MDGKDAQADAASLQLYKTEHRRVQQMRATEERLIPAVQRFTFPPEAAPHSLASQPPPSYITPVHARSPAPRAYGISLDAFEGPPGPEKASVDADGTVGIGRYVPGRTCDMLEKALNRPQEDYTLLNHVNHRSAECAKFAERKFVGRGGKQGKTVAYAALDSDIHIGSGLPHHKSLTPNKHAQALDAQHMAFKRFESVSKRPVPPFVMDLGALGAAPDASGCASDHNPYAPRLNMKHHNCPDGETPKAIFQASMPSQDYDATAVSGCGAKHLRDTAQALRNYNVFHPHYRLPSAISMMSTAFARSPKAPYLANQALASPCERIAANYSQAAWGLSARTLQLLSRAAISKPCTPEASAIDVGNLGAADHRLPLMPLELFDDVELEMRTPQEWLSCGNSGEPVMGVTSWLNTNTGETEVRKVCVEGYDEQNQTFHVSFTDSGVKKAVKRLNLRFDAEDASKFTTRVEAARARRASAEADLRWRFFIDSSDAEDVLDVYDFAAKVAAVHEGCRGITDQVLTHLQPELIRDFYDNYCLAIRIGHLEYHRLNPAIQQQLDVLGLPPAKPKQQAPQKGVHDVADTSTSIPFEEVVAWARRGLLVASPILNGVLQKLHQVFMKARSQVMFGLYPCTADFILFRPDSTYTFEDAGPWPWSVQQLDTVLSSHTACVASYLQTLSAEVLNMCCGHDVRQALLGAEANDLLPGDPLDKNMLGLLLRSSIQMRAACLDMVLASAQAFAHALGRDATDQAGGKGVVVVLKVDLEYAEGKVICHPGLAEISEILLQTLDNVASRMREVQDECMGAVQRTLNAPPLSVDGWCSEPTFIQCRNTVDKGISDCLKSVHAVRDMYSDLAAGLDYSLEELLEEYKNAELDRYDHCISFFQNQVEAVNGTDTQVTAGLFVVNSGAMKYALVHRALGFKAALLAQIAERQLSSNQEIIVSFQQQEATILRQAQTTEECLQLSKDIADAELQLEELRETIAFSRDIDKFLEKYRWSVQADAIDLRCEAYGWPQAMEEVIESAKQKQAQELTQFQRKLKAETSKLQEHIDHTSKQLSEFASLNDVNEQVEYAALGSQLMQQLEAASDTAASINSEETLFELTRSEWPRIGQLQKELQPYLDLWAIVSEFNMKYDDWMYGPFIHLDAAMMDETVHDWLKKMVKLARGLPREDLRGVADTLREKLEDFKANLGLLGAICNPGMRGRHWQAISTTASFKVVPSEDESLHNLLQNGLLTFEKEIQDISDSASREAALEKQLDSMQLQWAGVMFELSPWKNTEGYVLKGSSVDEAQMLLDDHIIKSQAMASSPFCKPFQERITMWAAKLNKMQKILDEWLTTQVKWMYLGPVFGTDEISKKMPKERKEFMSADGKYRRIMLAVLNSPEVLNICGMDGLLEDLIESNKALSTVEKSLARFLDSIKSAFARFWFLSNDELLEIISETASSADRVQPFVKKCFEAVQFLKFEQNSAISGCTSIEGEVIVFDSKVDSAGESNGVEQWLLQVEQVMMKSLHTITAQAVKAYAVTKREDWIINCNCGQAVLAVSQIYWTKEVAVALQAGGAEALQTFADKCAKELMAEIEMVRGDLSNLERATLGALVVIDVHARDVLAAMVKDGVCAETDFAWQAQLRYYWEENTVIVRMLNATANYGFEYLGNSSRLVITPLTDRCYRTLLGAHHLSLGGAPAGPAGTGKTETTKDLSKAVAIMCVVFNCSDQLDYIAMGKFFKGLACSGAWACFDEFNRIELEVLSVVAQQVLTIQRAKAAGLTRFIFEGVEMGLIHTTNCFITMNPGYAGRSELPDNLKALFRDVAMMVPDYALIAENTLFSFGFFEGRILGVKLVQTYRLCSEQLSKQEHYDYGMRAVVAVLRAAGNLKRKYPDEKEDVLMLRAINDVNLPKFLDQDVPLFSGILSDLFPGIDLPELDYTDLIGAIKDNCHKQNVQPLESFVIKVIQLYEMIVVRHGLMLVGWSSIKTSCIRILAAALTDLHSNGLADEHKVKMWTLNPKSVTMGQLYGEDDPVSKEWTDGVLAVEFRNAARDTSEDRKWVVLDGPVDAIWIENMNTVLDDNKKLCLNSGEIIAMQGLMNMIFEVQDLAVASPATVSRCGMVYVQPSLLGWRPLLDSWFATLPSSFGQHRETIKALAEWLLPPCLRLVTRMLHQPVIVQEQTLVMSLLRLFEAEMQPVLGCDPGMALTVKPSDLEAAIQCMWLFCMIWTLGGSLDESGRFEFDQQFRLYLVEKYDERVSIAVTQEGVKLLKPIPKDGSVFNYIYVFSSNSWKEWLDTVPKQALDDSMQIQNITVVTEDVVRYTHLIDAYVQSYHPVLLVGPTGTGKSAYIKDYLRKLDNEAWVVAVFQFSAQTSQNMTQDIIDGKLDKRRKGVFGPPIGKHQICLVDDLNMPQVEKYGAQPPIELLRQYMDHYGWYDRKQLMFNKIVDLQLCAAMGPPGGGRNNVTNRFLRHFCLISMTEFQDPSKRLIFTSLANWWLSKSKYSDDILRTGTKLADASLQIYTACLQELLPTPSRSHYTWNLRDLSSLFNGMAAAGATLDSVDGLARLWTHESLRVFGDRLVDDQDRRWFAGALKSAMETHFRLKWTNVLNRLADSGGEVGHVELRSLLFGDFMVPGADPPLYIELTDPDDLSQVVTTYLEEYNSNSKAPMNLVLFTFALEHVVKISRILRQPGGNALLVGLGGSGRQSLTRLAAFMNDYKLAGIELTSTYSRGDWCDDLRATLRQAGEKGLQTVFLFSDTQIKDERMVEDLSNLLNTGEVPNLFDGSDQVSICEGVSARAKKVGMDGSRADLFAFFVAELQRNLHIALAFSPIPSDAFRTRLRMFPSLVTATTIDWFTAWPEDALKSTADRFLADVDLPAGLHAKVGAQCMLFHSGICNLTLRFELEAKRHYYVTAASYLQLLNAFKSLQAKKSFEISCAKRRYEQGLDQLLFTEAQVSTMKEELEILRPQLLQASEETDALLINVEKETAAADKVKAVVSVDEAGAKEEAAKVTAIKEECEADLSEAMPALNAAIKALDTLTKNDITEVKGMKSPPAAVKMVLEAVCIIKGLKPTKVKDADGKMVMDYWETAKKMMNDNYFLDSLKSFDKDNIDAEIVKKLQPIISKEEFEPKKVLKVSKAAFGLASWVKAMETYDRVAKVVGPKKKALAEAEAQLKVVMDALGIKQKELKEVVDKLDHLDEQLRSAKLKKADLEAEFKLCSEKLDRAGKLIGGLGGEKSRWTDNAANLGNQMDSLCGDMLISAAVIAYLGPFTVPYRNDALQSWVASVKDAGIPSSDVYKFTSTLGDPVQIRQWQIAGLPKDDFSCSNGIIISHSERWPLAIDPQGQTNRWIRTMHADDQLVIVKMSDKNYLRRMETAIQLGHPVLMENVEEYIDAAIEPVLLKQTFKSAGSLMIKLGESSVEWSPHFKMFMTTKLRNPHYAPEICTKVALLNFMTTPEGLEDQLLGIVVAQERPDLEKQKNQLVVQGAQNKKRLQEIESAILKVLSDSKGNILEDEGAVNILQESKVVSDEINRKQRAAEKTEKSIDDARVSYKSIAEHVSMLFFCVMDMATIDPMYQYSLSYFVNLFLRSINDAPKSKDVPTRLELLEEHFSYFLFINVCRSLFDRHKLLFAFKLALVQEPVAPVLLNFLLTGGISMENAHVNPLAGAMSDKSWGEVCRLTELSGRYEGLRESVASDPSQWQKIISANNPQEMEFPLTDLNEFEKLVLLRALRPDKVVPGMQNYVISVMGKKYIEPQEFKLEPIYADSEAAVPLIFILSPGADPMADLLMFAEEKAKRVEAVSLGQGQGPVAESWIREGLRDGFWVVLQNCHLAKTFLPRLEQMCEKELMAEDVNPDFRLWLTSYPSPIFPIAITESGMKITNEAPAGLRAGLERIYKADPVNDPRFFEGCKKESEFKAMIFSLAFFHCVIVGRKAYGPVGWNIPYMFNENDLRISMRQLRMFLDEYEDVPLDMLTYTCGECNYGGKVTDGKDRRTLMTILSDFYNEQVEGDLSLSPSGLYVIPRTGSYGAYLKYMATLPLTENPEVFGLHENATVTRSLQMTQQTLDTLLLSQPRDSGSGGGPAGISSDTVIFNTAADILDKIPQLFDVEEAQRKHPIMYNESMNTVLVQELGRVNVLLTEIMNSLKELQRAVKGLVILSLHLEQVGDSLVVGKVPESWLAKSFPSLKPLGPYIKEVIERCTFFSRWVDEGPPVVFWLTGFFFTQAFLTGVKQNFARKYTIPIDTVDFDFEFKDREDDGKQAPGDGAFVNGMFFEAAAWDYNSHELCESQPKVLFSPVPIIHFQAKKVEEMLEFVHYTCPMYKTSERRGILSTTGHSTNFVLDVKVPTHLGQKHWIKRGTAMLTSLDN